MLLSLNTELSPLSDRLPVIVGFPEESHAKNYVDYIRKLSITKATGFRVARGKGSRHVELHLPKQIGSITRSAEVPGGFYFTIDDKLIAHEWVEDMLIWEFAEGSENEVFVSKTVDEDYLMYEPDNN
ncbi:hypothetical protein PG996_014091 [Apiospora saccharicola]|uniref:Uncharacterized protein n=1 Tax=Apiospora saccharicola TaxID=335842 RepID=A0ABR1TI01_9PEZI